MGTARTATNSRPSWPSASRSQPEANWLAVPIFRDPYFHYTQPGLAARVPRAATVLAVQARSD